MPYKINKQTGGMDFINASTGRVLSTPTVQQPAPQQGGFLRSVANTLLPRTSELMKKARAGITLSALTDEQEKDREKRQKLIEQVIAQSKQEADPIRRRELLSQARDLSKQSTDQINEVITNFEKESGTKIGDKDRVMAEALGVAGELGTWLLPAGKLAKAGQTGKLISRAGQIAEATTATQRILKGAKLGATVGAISAVTDPNRDTAEEKFKGVLTEGGTGFLVGGATSAAFEGLGKAAQKFLGEDKSRKEALKRLFRMTPSKRREIRSATGGMDFEAEILARDAQEIAGMNYEQMLNHFAGKAKVAEDELENILSNSKNQISRKELISSLQRQINKLDPKKGNVATRSAISSLQEIIDDLNKIPAKGPRYGKPIVPEGVMTKDTGEATIPVKVVKNIARTAKEVISKPGSRIESTKPVGLYGPVVEEVGKKSGRLVQSEVPVAVQAKDALISLTEANRIKQQLQALGDAAFSPNSKSTITSDTFANASKVVKEAIEKAAQTGDKNVVKEANRTIQLYQAAKNAIETTGDREAVKISNGIVQKFLQQIPALSLGAGAIGGTVAGGPLGGVGGTALALLLVGGSGAARVKYLSPEVQTRMIARFQGVLEKQGVQGAAEIAKQVTQEISKQVARYATLTPGIEEPEQESQGVTPEVAPSTGQPVGTIGQQQTTAEPQQLQGEANAQANQATIQQPVNHSLGVSDMVTIRNKKTGETQQVPKSKLSKYGLAGDASDALPGLPSKGEILAAMVLDAQKGGKNIAKLKTILDAYDQVDTDEGKVVPATQAGGLGDFDSAISLMDEVGAILAKSSDKFGPVKGGLGAANPYNVEAQQIDADLRRAAQIVGKAMEGGVLRKEDEIKYRRMLPKLTDTAEVAQYKMEQVKAMLERNRAQRIQALKSAGYNPETDKITGGTAQANPIEF